MTKQQLDRLLERHLSYMFSDPYWPSVRHVLLDGNGELWYVSDQLGTTEYGDAIHRAVGLDFLPAATQAILRQRHAEEGGMKLSTRDCACCDRLDAMENCDCPCHDEDHDDDCDCGCL